MIKIKLISSEEATKIRKKYPDIHIASTNRQGPSRKRTYYVTEYPKVIKYLNQLRGIETRHTSKRNRRGV